MNLGIKKISAVAGVAITATLLSGCTLQDITGGNTDNNAAIIPTSSTEATATEIQNQAQDGTEISDEAFEKAFTKYLKENPIKFGKQVDGAFQIYQKDLQKQQAKEQAKKDKERSEKIKNIRNISEADHIEGNKDATFVLFEYSDFHCPFCKRFNATTKEFLANNDDVALVFRAFPAIHKTTSQPIHEAAECVAKEAGNEAFWKFSNNAFSTQFRAKDIKAKLSELKIANSEKIEKCIADGKFRTLVDESAQEAVSLGINGTPGSILKNMKTGEVLFINGAQPLEALQAAKAQLSEAK